jgi:hypothetical protein
MNLKIKLLTALLFVACIQQGIAQTTFKDFFNPDSKLTYLGVDYTLAKVYGQTDIEINNLITRDFAGINNLVISEPERYDLPKFFHKSEVVKELSLVEAHNKKIDADKLKSADGNDKSLTAADIEKLVKGYDFSGKKGMGVILVAEHLYKIEKAAKGTLHVVFVDMEKNKVLFSEKFASKPSGFTLRNYWAKIVYTALDEIGDSKYKSWKKANG